MISSKDNKTIKNIRKLLTASKFRRESKKFVIEGLRIVLDAPEGSLLGIYYNTEFKSQNATVINELTTKHPLAEFEEVKDSVFDSITETVNSQGIIAICQFSDNDIDALINNNSDNDRYLVLEGIRDPGNLGTLIRTSEASGVKGVILTKGCVDLYSPKVVRSTMGTIFRVPVVTGLETIDIIKYFRDNSIQIVSTSLNNSTDLYETEINNKVSVWIGNEANGLSSLALENSDILVRIPMSGEVESLNAAVAGSIVLYELYIRRK